MSNTTLSAPTLNLTMSSKQARCPTEKMLAMELTHGQSKRKHTIDATDTMVSKRSRPDTNNILPNRNTSPDSNILPDEGADMHDRVIDMTGEKMESDIDEPQNSEGELGKIYVL